MKKRRLLPLMALLCITLFIAGFTSEDDTEKEEIRKAIEDYFFKGKLESDKELLSQIIHEDWCLHNVHNGKLEKYERSDFFSWVDGESKAKFKIEYIDVTEGVASAKTTEDEGSMIWVDYFNLVKVDGKWWIIDKVAYPLRKLASKYFHS
ncbi:MAG: nuclear transport factor 2 family protein [bacterium]|nr:nuclear transport factor 2 family protein [bacterium]